MNVAELIALLQQLDPDTKVAWYAAGPITIPPTHIDNILFVGGDTLFIFSDRPLRRDNIWQLITPITEHLAKREQAGGG